MKRTVSRRDFLKAGVGAGAASVLAGPARLRGGVPTGIPGASSGTIVVLASGNGLAATAKAMELLKQYVADRFPGCVPEEVHCGGDPVTRWLKPLVRGGVMLVGDAARQVDCLTGGGITYAMVAGKLAGTAAAQACTGGTCDRRALAGYERRWARTCGKQQARSYALKRVAVGYDDAMLDWIARAFEGRKPSDVSYVKILLRAFSRRPLLMLKALLLFR